MFLFELFGGTSGMIDNLRQQVMDYLTPMAAKKVNFIPMSNIEDILRNAKTGLVIDRGLIMKLIEPNICKLVTKIEGDKIFLSIPREQSTANTEDQEKRNKERVSKKAVEVAKKEIDK